MMRTVAPKDLGGRLLRNLARTTPELPGRGNVRAWIMYKASHETMLLAGLMQGCCPDRVDAYRGGG
jgi:hypothetical protein